MGEIHMRYILIITTLLAMSCGEDEPADAATFDELVVGYEIIWDPDVPSLDRSVSEMEPITCALASGTYARCYGLGMVCGEGKRPTVCLDDKAELVACKAGIASTAGPGNSLARLDKRADGKAYLEFSNPPEGATFITCED
jgi:hypothetical protein